jgi:hypothetical protein
MSKENDFKPKKNIRRICSYGDLDNIAYFCFFVLDLISIFSRFYKFWQIYQFQTFKSHFLKKFMSRPCALTHKVYALTHRPYALTHRVYALTHSGRKLPAQTGLRWQLSSGYTGPRRASLNMGAETSSINCHTPKHSIFFLSFVRPELVVASSFIYKCSTRFVCAFVMTT